jgi:hypothetical protein
MLMKKLLYSIFLLLPFLALGCQGGDEEIEDLEPSPLEIKQKLLIGHWIDEGTKEEFLDYSQKVISTNYIAPSGRDHVFDGKAVTVYKDGIPMEKVDYITGGGKTYFYLTFNVPGQNFIFLQREVLELDDQRLTFVDTTPTGNGTYKYTNKFSRRK